MSAIRISIRLNEDWNSDKNVMTQLTAQKGSANSLYDACMTLLRRRDRWTGVNYGGSRFRGESKVKGDSLYWSWVVKEECKQNSLTDVNVVIQFVDERIHLH